jgi:predicted RNA-binding Zn-ribbon protein involved in translation (DUF1610 family)
MASLLLNTRPFNCDNMEVYMIHFCPSCGSTELHSSRSKSLMDRALRALGLPPRRCAACGWRGYFARALSTARGEPAGAGAPFDAVARVRQGIPPRLRWSLPRIIVSILLFGAATGLMAWFLSRDPM